MAKKASSRSTGAKKKGAPKAAKKTVKARETRTKASAKTKPEKPDNAADALIGLIESPLVADLLAAAVTAAAATVIEHKLKKGRSEKSLIRAVGAATVAAVGQQLAAELEEIRNAAKEPKRAK